MKTELENKMDKMIDFGITSHEYATENHLYAPPTNLDIGSLLYLHEHYGDVAIINDGVTRVLFNEEKKRG